MQKCMSDYLDSVCDSISRRALRQAARSELTDHIMERHKELISQGWDAEPAAKEAIMQMGNPVELGKRITAANRPRSGAVTLLCGIGLALLGFVYIIFSIGGRLVYFIDPASLIAVAVLSSAYSLISCGGKPTLLKFLRGFKSGALYSGGLCLVVGCMVLLRTLDDLSAVGPGLAVALLSVAYGCIFSAAASAIENRVVTPEYGSIRGLLTEVPTSTSGIPQ